MSKTLALRHRKGNPVFDKCVGNDDVMKTDFFQFRFNKYSQNGEDGILEALTERIGLINGYFVEFGAWDGRRYSNCCYLYEKGWKGCFIEANPARFRSLVANFPDKSILKLNVFVEEEGKNSLDHILASQGVSHLDMLSVDIDSDDLAVWEGVRQYLPKILIIEYNPTIPFDTRYKNPKGKPYGNSGLSILEASNHKGYGLIEGTQTNLIFVRNEIIDDSGLVPKKLQEIKDQLNLARFFFGLDGMLLQEKARLWDSGITEFYRVPWTNYLALQPVPKSLRRYMDKKGAVYHARVVISLFLAFCRNTFEFCRFLRYVARIQSRSGPEEDDEASIL